MYRTFLLIITIIIATSAFSQNENKDTAVYENVKIRLINGKSSNVKKLHFVNDTTITFFSSHTLQPINMNTSQVKEHNNDVAFISFASRQDDKDAFVW